MIMMTKPIKISATINHIWCTCTRYIVNTDIDLYRNSERTTSISRSTRYYRPTYTRAHDAHYTPTPNKALCMGGNGTAPVLRVASGFISGKTANFFSVLVINALPGSCFNRFIRRVLHTLYYIHQPLYIHTYIITVNLLLYCIIPLIFLHL